MRRTVQSSFIIGALESAGTAHSPLSQNVQPDLETGLARMPRLSRKYMNYNGKGSVL
jgi:hypothetical protein